VILLAGRFSLQLACKERRVAYNIVPSSIANPSVTMTETTIDGSGDSGYTEEKLTAL
jgi:hypothetical protein